MEDFTLEFDFAENDDMMMEDMDNFDIDLFCSQTPKAKTEEKKDSLDHL